MKTIYINGRFLTQNITGVQRYAIEIVKALDHYIDLHKDFNDKYKIVILAPKNIKQKLQLNNIDIKVIGHLKGHLWEQIELPWHTRGNFLFNFCNCAPLVKKNQIVTIHDVAVCAVPYAYSKAFRYWYKFMYSVLTHRLNKIFTVSNFSKNELHKYFNVPLSKIEITYNGIDHMKNIIPDETAFDKFNIEKHNYVLAVSSLNPSKNFKLILETAKEMPDTNFVIAGGTNSKVFQSQGFKITPNIKFIGYVNDGELAALYKNAQCFVYPSIYEGFGIPPLEAIYYSCPVILSDIEVFKEIYGNNVLYCHNVDELLFIIQNRGQLIELKNIYNKEGLLNYFEWRKTMKYIFNNIIKE